MVLPLLDRIGHWNPQLFRELKGRLTPRNTIGAIAIAIGFQMLVLWLFHSQLSNDPNAYCVLEDTPPIDNLGYTMKCQVDEFGNFIIQWDKWWRNIQMTLSWILYLSLTVAGAYLLVNNIYQEEKQGTLNFIRLSPQSGYSILMGKMLGVPILVYVFALSLVPLHAIAGLNADVPIASFLSYYTMLIAGCFFLFSSALLSGLWSKSQTSQPSNSEFVGNPTLLVAALIVIGFIPVYLIWNIRTNPLFADVIVGLDAVSTVGISWFWFVLGDRHFIFSNLFTLANLGLGSYWVWQALQRRFHNPNATLVSKAQSYGITLYSAILILGFVWIPEHTRSSSPSEEAFEALVFLLSVCVVLGMFLLTILLLPPRQTLLDWARFRHVQTLEISTALNPRRPAKRGFIGDLLRSEKSPIVMTMLVNLGIVAIAFLPWFLTQAPHWSIVSPLLLFLMTLNMLAIYSAIAQWLSSIQSKHRKAWVALTFSFLGVLPFVVAVVAGAAHQNALSQIALMVSPLPTTILIMTNGLIPPLTLIGLTLLGQWTGAILINIQITRQLRKAGESSSKALFQSQLN